jgi:hypothetical protein
VLLFFTLPTLAVFCFWAQRIPIADATAINYCNSLSLPPSLSLSLSLSHTHTHSLRGSRWQTRQPSITATHTHSLTHSHTHTHSLTHSLTLPPSLTQRIPMADATAINYCNIPLTALAAAVLLGDSFGRLDIACMVACFVGVMLVVQVLR